MNKLLVLLVPLGLLLPALAGAAPEPEAPLFTAQIPAGLTCVETITYPALDRFKASPPPEGAGRFPALPAQRRITRAGDLVRVADVFDDGAGRTVYYHRGLVLLRNGKGNVEIHYPASETWDDDFGATDFPEIAALRLSDGAGDGDKTGRDLEDGSNPQNPVRVLVNAETLLPVLLESPGKKITYRYEKDPVPLVLPPDLKRVYNALPTKPSPRNP